MVSSGGDGFLTTESEARGGWLMGKLARFLEYDRAERPSATPRERVGDYREFVAHRCRSLELRARARAAWSAASRSATAAARSGT